MVKAENCGEQLTNFRKATEELLKLFHSYQLAGGRVQEELDFLASRAGKQYPACADEFCQIVNAVKDGVRVEIKRRIAGSSRRVRRAS